MSAAGAASLPAGGAVRFFATPSLNNGGDGTIVIAGALGDYGKTTPANKQGIGEAILKKGTLEVNLKSIQKTMNNAAPTVADKATCSYSFSGSAPVSIIGGTGLYKGISGSGTITETFAFIGPLYQSGAKKGQCNTSNSANPLAQWGSVTGVLNVKFS